jgi:hypothetical protein
MLELSRSERELENAFLQLFVDEKARRESRKRDRAAAAAAAAANEAAASGRPETDDQGKAKEVER